MSNPIHVLMGDDDDFVLESCEAFLIEEGFKVTTASSPEVLFAVATSGDPDVILSDYDYGFRRSETFPNGVAIGTTLRNAGITIPFVIFSGLHRPDAVEAGFPCWSKGDIVEMSSKIIKIVNGVV